MSLYRFGGAAVRLGRVLAIKQDRAQGAKDEAACPHVRVYFAGSRSATFDGEDAGALIRFVEGLPLPPTGPEGFSSGGPSPVVRPPD